MKSCAREIEVASALRSGVWSAELKGHLLSCASCAEAEQVATVLLRGAIAIGAGQGPAAVDVVWRRAEVRAQELALKRATRPLIVMRGVSFVCVAIVGVWLARGLSRVDLSSYRSMMPGFDLIVTRAVLFGFAFALLLIAAGSWLLLRNGKGGNGVVSSV